MPLLRKLFPIGGYSKAAVLPAEWVKYYEEKFGCQITEIEIEVNGELRIRPHIKEAQAIGTA